MPGKESDFPSRRDRKELGRMMKTGELGRDNHALLPVQQPPHAYESVGSVNARPLAPEQTAKFYTNTRYNGA